VMPWATPPSSRAWCKFAAGESWRSTGQTSRRYI
jgi:hypothetical protein